MLCSLRRVGSVEKRTITLHWRGKAPHYDTLHHTTHTTLHHTTHYQHTTLHHTPLGSPAILDMISGPLIRKKKAAVSLATARAISVLAPGGPCIRIPRGGLIPRFLNKLGCRRGSSTILRICSKKEICQIFWEVYTTLHYTTLQCLHYSALKCTTLHYTTPHYTTAHWWFCM